jgi:hypothetical protein
MMRLARSCTASRMRWSLDATDSAARSTMADSTSAPSSCLLPSVAAPSPAFETGLLTEAVNGSAYRPPKSTRCDALPCKSKRTSAPFLRAAFSTCSASDRMGDARKSIHSDSEVRAAASGSTCDTACSYCSRPCTMSEVASSRAWAASTWGSMVVEGRVTWGGRRAVLRHVACGDVSGRHFRVRCGWEGCSGLCRVMCSSRTGWRDLLDPAESDRVTNCGMRLQEHSEDTVCGPARGALGLTDQDDCWSMTEARLKMSRTPAETAPATHLTI